MDDRQALYPYAHSGSQEAFAVLAGRYVDLVYSAARRQLRDSHLADDVTQAVFIILAKKAGSIRGGAHLSVWLYRTTRYACRNAIRQNARRAIHERSAAQMREYATENSPPAAESEDDIKLLIDQAITSLGRKDRDVLLLRYFQKCSVPEVSATLGISEEAARKRIARAVDRLSDYFQQRGITAPFAALNGGLLLWAVEKAPHAVHAAAAAPLSLATTAATLKLAKGAMFMMSLKTKIAVTAAITAVLFSGTTILVVAAARPGAADAAGVAVNANKAQQLTQEGWQLWQQRKLAQAEARFAAATKLDPKLVDAWNGLGWSQFNQANNSGAQTAWETVIALDPSHAAAQNGLGWVYFSQNDHAKAEEHWLISAKTPDASASWSGLARIYLLQGKWDQAKLWAGKLVDSGDATAKPWLEAALAGHVSDALKTEISPPAPPTAAGADVAKGWQLLNQNRVADAVAVFRMAISKEPKDTNALNGLGWALMRTNKTADAQAQFQKALDVNPNHGGAMNGLAILLKKQGKLDQAIELWTKLDAMNPDATNGGTYALARTYLEGKQYDKALPYLQRLAKDLPDDAYVQKGLTEAKSHTGT